MNLSHMDEVGLNSAGSSLRQAGGGREAGRRNHLVGGVAWSRRLRLVLQRGGRPLLLTTARSSGDPDVVVFMPEGSAEGLVVEDLYGAGERVYRGRPRGRPALVFILRRKERDFLLGEGRGGYIQEEAQHS